MKLVAGAVIIVAGAIVAAVATTVSILWWSTADIIRQIRR